MSYKRILPAGLVFFFLACFVACNSFAADLKIGVINVQRIIVSCESGKAAKERFDAKMKELQGSFKKEEEALKVLQDEIKKKSSAWSEEKKAEKVREYQKNGRELQAKTDDARFEMKQLQDKELEPILKALEKVVIKFGKEKSYTAILDSKNGVVYFDDAIEVSDAIIKKLNEAMSGK
ncbi:MAG: OmpH family outer membrane protein [Pseudomonadota bacterium]